MEKEDLLLVKNVMKQLIDNGQVATQYVDFNGNANI